jgi:hypothetical protein
MTQTIIDKNNAKYDERHDVLHVFLAPTKSYWGDEDYPGIFFERAVDDDSTIGLVILDFKKRDEESLRSKLPDYDFSRISRSE